LLLLLGCLTRCYVLLLLLSLLQVKSDAGKVAAAAGLLEELRSKGDGDFQQTIDDMVAQVGTTMIHHLLFEFSPPAS
jgi:hypothetical protein